MRVADTHVPDELYQRVAAQFEEAEFVALTLGVSVINTWNRLSVSFRPPVGSSSSRQPSRYTARSSIASATVASGWRVQPAPSEDRLHTAGHPRPR